MTWQKICTLDAIPQLGARVLNHPANGDIAVFRTHGNQVFALDDRCPHRGGPLSQGIVQDGAVTCPLHNWRIGLVDGQACAPDEGCARHYPVRVDDGAVWIDL